MARERLRIPRRCLTLAVAFVLVVVAACADAADDQSAHPEGFVGR